MPSDSPKPEPRMITDFPTAPLGHTRAGGAAVEKSQTRLAHKNPDSPLVDFYRRVLGEKFDIAAVPKGVCSAVVIDQILKRAQGTGLKPVELPER